jgi:naphthoate synthase
VNDYADIVVEVEDHILTITINRPESGNKFRHQTAIELAVALREFRADRDLRVAILTGSGEKFFCIGGEHDPVESVDYGSAMPIIDVYELIDATPKPIIAAVNGFAVGGGNVLHVMCDLTIAADNALFRQVGPIVGSFDPGYGTWYLEEAIGRKRAKEMWYLNRKYTAEQALAIGLINEVVPKAELASRAQEVARELLERSPIAIAALKGAFSARHTGVVGQARLAHDQMLSLYQLTGEAHEVSSAFADRRTPDESHFWA